MIMCIQILSIHSYDMEQKPNSELVNQSRAVTLLQTCEYNTNVDVVNDDVYTKFGLILSIRSQDIE